LVSQLESYLRFLEEGDFFIAEINLFIKTVNEKHLKEVMKKL